MREFTNGPSEDENTGRGAQDAQDCERSDDLLSEQEATRLSLSLDYMPDKGRYIRITDGIRPSWNGSAGPTRSHSPVASLRRRRFLLELLLVGFFVGEDGLGGFPGGADPRI